ncbi:MAG: T9SS type A sorting domain-containing protein, partial [Saprospiraceae bacterium]|nr:T9SS type A sorting domain-containing protein [Saprospiraceae bacterium]
NGGTGKRGVLISQNSDGSIVDCDIKATYYPVSSAYSRCNVDACNIELVGGSLLSDCAVSIFGTSGKANGSISDSYIDVTKGQAAVRLNNCSNFKVEHNDIEHLSNSSTASILCLSGGGENFIEANEVYGTLSHGVLAVNSANNMIGCNEFDTDDIAVDIEENAQIQEIFENDLYGDNHNVLIKSVIGVQKHHFNVFDGYAEAVGLSNIGVFRSRFIIDPITESLPTDWDPSNFVQQLTNTENITKECSGTVGPRMKNLMLDTTFICTHLDSLEAQKDSFPKFYWINLYHLFKFYLLNIPSQDWPDCISDAWDEEFDCGMKELLNAEQHIHEILFEGSKSYNSKLDSLSGLVFPAIDSNDWNSANSLIDSIVGYSDLRDSLFLDAISDRIDSLESLDCTDTLASKWIETYLLNLKLLGGDSLTASDKSVLESNASLCSNEYGDVVQWARQMVAEYDTTRYTDSGCTPVLGRSIKQQNNQSNLEFIIFPNPVNEVVHIEKPKGIEGYTLEVINNTGQKVYQKNYITENVFKINTNDLTDGVYFITILQNNKVVQTEKIIKL